MRLGLQVGFGQSILGEVPYLLGRNITFVRQDLQDKSDVECQSLLAELTGSGIEGYFIMRGWQLRFAQPGTLCELVNEPTLDYPGRPAMTPAQYADEWNTYGIEAQERGVRVYAGCAHNIYPKTMQWTQDVWNLMRVKPLYAAIHRYPEDAGPTAPHPGYASREAEVMALRAIIGDVPLVVSECGYTQAPRKVKYGPFGWRTRMESWTPEQSAEYLRWELNFWYNKGTDAFIWYQINSSETDQFGIKDVNGADKEPIVNVFREGF